MAVHRDTAMNDGDGALDPEERQGKDTAGSRTAKAATTAGCSGSWFGSGQTHANMLLEAHAEAGPTLRNGPRTESPSVVQDPMLDTKCCSWYKNKKVLDIFQVKGRERKEHNKTD